MKRKYLLRLGSHQDESGLYRANTPNNVVESEVDLAARWPGKFVPYEAALAQQDPALGVNQPATRALEDDSLDGMTVAELKKVAADEEIEIDGLSRKEEIIKAIRSAMQLANA